MEQEIWFAIEVSDTGANDWFAHENRRYDTAKSAQEALELCDRFPEAFEFRVVRKTLVTEVV